MINFYLSHPVACRGPRGRPARLSGGRARGCRGRVLEQLREVAACSADEIRARIERIERSE